MSRRYEQHGRRHGPNGSDPIPGIYRIVYGQVANSTTGGPNSDGILDPGSGDWTVTGDDSGNWTVTFGTSFSEIPTVVASENQDTTNPPSFIQVTGVSASDFTIQTWQGQGDPPILSNDIGYNFHAVGT